MVRGMPLFFVLSGEFTSFVLLVSSSRLKSNCLAESLPMDTKKGHIKGCCIHVWLMIHAVYLSMDLVLTNGIFPKVYSSILLIYLCGSKTLIYAHIDHYPLLCLA